MKEDLVLIEAFSISLAFSISHLVYECKIDLFNFNNKKILKWKSTGTFNYSDYYSMKGIENTKKAANIKK